MAKKVIGINKSKLMDVINRTLEEYKNYFDEDYELWETRRKSTKMRECGNKNLGQILDGEIKGLKSYLTNLNIGKDDEANRNKVFWEIRTYIYNYTKLKAPKKADFREYCPIREGLSRIEDAIYEAFCEE